MPSTLHVLVYMLLIISNKQHKRQELEWNLAEIVLYPYCPQIQNIIPFETPSPPLLCSPHYVHKLLLVCTGARLGIAVLTCAHGVERGSGHSCQNGESDVDFSCHANRLWLCWKNRALLFLSLCLGLSPSQSVCHSSFSLRFPASVSVC